MTKQNNTQPVTPEAQVANAPVEDIVSRVNKATNDATSDASTSNVDKYQQLEASVNEAFVKPEELAAIKDPIARSIIERKQKEMLSGMNKKFQDLAEYRKSLEAEKQQLSQSKSKYDVTTKEGLRAALNDPDFVSLVNQVAQETQSSTAPTEWNGSQDDWSGLSDSDKRAWQQMQEKVSRLEQSQTKYEISKIDNSIKDKYTDYDSSKIDTFISDLNSGKYSTAELREFVHKGISYETGLKRAYDIALSEKSGDMQNKIQAISLNNSMTNKSSTSQDIADKGNKSFKQLFAERFAQAQ